MRSWSHISAVVPAGIGRASPAGGAGTAVVVGALVVGTVVVGLAVVVGGLVVVVALVVATVVVGALVVVVALVVATVVVGALVVVGARVVVVVVVSAAAANSACNCSSATAERKSFHAVARSASNVKPLALGSPGASTFSAPADASGSPA
jgi:hypothetical protein